MRPGGEGDQRRSRRCRGGPSGRARRAGAPSAIWNHCDESRMQPPVDAVGHRPAEQHEGEQRHLLGEAAQARGRTGRPSGSGSARTAPRPGSRCRRWRGRRPPTAGGTRGRRNAARKSGSPRGSLVGASFISPRARTRRRASGLARHRTRGWPAAAARRRARSPGRRGARPSSRSSSPRRSRPACSAFCAFSLRWRRRRISLLSLAHSFLVSSLVLGRARGLGLLEALGDPRPG